MVDVHDKKTRSYNMSKISGKDTKPEIIVRRFLHSNGFRYRLHVKDLPGKPDIVLKKYKTIVDIRGCFWHKHKECKFGDQVDTDSEVISIKRNTAVTRDNENMIAWSKLGWNVIVIWTKCELEPRKKNSTVRNRTLNELVKKIKNGDTSN